MGHQATDGSTTEESHGVSEKTKQTQNFPTQAQNREETDQQQQPCHYRPESLEQQLAAGDHQPSSQRRERSVKELEAILKTLSQSALSQHLGRLRRAHILKTRRDSQMIYYSIRDEEVEKIMDFLIDIYPDDPSLPY